MNTNAERFFKMGHLYKYRDDADIRKDYEHFGTGVPVSRDTIYFCVRRTDSLMLVILSGERSGEVWISENLEAFSVIFEDITHEYQPPATVEDSEWKAVLEGKVLWDDVKMPKTYARIKAEKFLSYYDLSWEDVEESERMLRNKETSDDIS